MLRILMAVVLLILPCFTVSAFANLEVLTTSYHVWGEMSGSVWAYNPVTAQIYLTEPVTNTYDVSSSDGSTILGSADYYGYSSIAEASGTINSFTGNIVTFSDAAATNSITRGWSALEASWEFKTEATVLEIRLQGGYHLKTQIAHSLIDIDTNQVLLDNNFASLAYTMDWYEYNDTIDVSIDPSHRFLYRIYNYANDYGSGNGAYSNFTTSVTAASVPEPTTLLLLGLGLVGLAIFVVLPEMTT